MKNKKLQEADAGLSDFASGMRTAAQGMASAVVDPLANTLIATQKNKNDWISNFVNRVMSDLSSAESRYSFGGKKAAKGKRMAEARLQQLYIKMIVDEDFRQSITDRGHDINQAISTIEKMFEAAPAPQHLFQLRSNEQPLSATDYIKTYILPRYLDAARINQLSSKIDSTLATADQNYPNIAKELNVLAGLIYPYVSKPKTAAQTLGHELNKAQN